MYCSKGPLPLYERFRTDFFDKDLNKDPISSGRFTHEPIPNESPKIKYSTRSLSHSESGLLKPYLSLLKIA